MRLSGINRAGQEERSGRLSKWESKVEGLIDEGVEQDEPSRWENRGQSSAIRKLGSQKVKRGKVKGRKIERTENRVR